jgi:hypothetical protein
MPRAHRKIGEILVDLGVIRDHDVIRVLAALSRRPDRRKFGQMAQAMGLLRGEHVLAALAVQMVLFPGIDRMALGQILTILQGPKPETPPPNARSALRRPQRRGAAVLRDRGEKERAAGINPRPRR